MEVAILLVNRMRCPLTGVAARYTDDRADNFDIFLPEWLARHNKLIFGTLFALGEVYLLWRWALRLTPRQRASIPAPVGSKLRPCPTSS